MRILRFTAAWCGPCKALSKNLESVQTIIPIEVVDIDVHPEVAADYGIRSVPTLILLDGNTEIKRSVGLKNKTELQQWMET